jgi:hypothetical protein
MKPTDQAFKDIVVADILRSTTALQVAIFEYMDGQPFAVAAMKTVAEKILREVGRL